MCMNVCFYGKLCARNSREFISVLFFYRSIQMFNLCLSLFFSVTGESSIQMITLSSPCDALSSVLRCELWDFVNVNNQSTYSDSASLA